MTTTKHIKFRAVPKDAVFLARGVTYRNLGNGTAQRLAQPEHEPYRFAPDEVVYIVRKGKS